ncbi:MAG: NrfD/PsrC family molybdoenzyme membrane anchor subunit, partial [Planctomycetota bacterium]
PYDALYLNPDTGTAEKCHYCAHRTELGLEPACVSVCPEQAIVAGDADDPVSGIAGMIRDLPTRQRKPEKETRPRIWYVDALEEALVPGSTTEPPQWLWADRRSAPPTVNGFETPPDLVTTLNVDHPPVWGSHIPAYLLTKNLAAGAMIVAPFLTLLGTPGGLWPETAGLFFLAATLVLLVLDLERPERFLKLLLHPNPRSWLVKGTWVLTAFGGVTAASFVAGFFGRVETVRWLRFADLPLAVLASGYSAFLFRQCRGRDLWLEPGLFGQLVLRAALLGTGLAILVTVLLPEPPPAASGLVFAVLALASLAGIAISQKSRGGSRDLRRARALFRCKKASRQGRGLLVVAAVLAASGAVTGAVPIFGGPALLAAAAGLFLVEKAWIEAGQEVPLS